MKRSSNQVWKILDDYFLCFEGNAKELEEEAPHNTNVNQPSFETDDEEELEELLMADHNEPRPRSSLFFLEKLQKKAKAKGIALMEDLFLDDFYEARPLHVFLDQLCIISEQ
ncbi:hypothetical protein Ddye_022878 [Dipteronia dyeriana]|uniref:Uncharacterized protein n=1 Tax=Dipteronia dyeriana TaxID=168575 RepID=A0AAD9WSV2_9ROSI|nr:hypothetical protein Ddye_022878 [Dipteronia dyeriana]